MKVYVCYPADTCNGTDLYPNPDSDHHPWVGFTNEGRAKKWVENKDLEFEELRRQGKVVIDGESVPDGAGYKEVEIEII